MLDCIVDLGEQYRVYRVGEVVKFFQSARTRSTALGGPIGKMVFCYALNNGDVRVAPITQHARKTDRV
jgi:hypothetical protein